MRIIVLNFTNVELRLETNVFITDTQVESARDFDESYNAIEGVADLSI